MSQDPPIGVKVTQNTFKLVADGERRGALVLIETLARDERFLKLFVYHVGQAASKAGVEAECFSQSEIDARLAGMEALDGELVKAEDVYGRYVPIIKPFNPGEVPS